MKQLKILFVCVIFLLALNVKSQINVDNKKILIIGSVFQTATGIPAGQIYQGDSIFANKQFKAAALRVAKFGTPVLITDQMDAYDYTPHNWVLLFDRWGELAMNSQECYIMKGKEDGMMQFMLLYWSMVGPKQADVVSGMEIHGDIALMVPEKRNLLIPTDTLKTVYYNTLCTRTVTKKDCPIGYYGTKVQYRVPAKKYCSTISQATAQAAAVKEAETNKQANANKLGTCIKK